MGRPWEESRGETDGRRVHCETGKNWTDKAKKDETLEEAVKKNAPKCEINNVLVLIFSFTSTFHKSFILIYSF
jgi:hypothetical protein